MFEYVYAFVCMHVCVCVCGYVSIHVIVHNEMRWQYNKDVWVCHCRFIYMNYCPVMLHTCAGDFLSHCVVNSIH